MHKYIIKQKAEREARNKQSEGSIEGNWQWSRTRDRESDKWITPRRCNRPISKRRAIVAGAISLVSASDIALNIATAPPSVNPRICIMAPLPALSTVVRYLLKAKLCPRVSHYLPTVADL